AIRDYTTENVRVYAYGKKGSEYFARRGYTIAASYENKRDDVPRSETHELARELSRGFLAHEYDKVIAVYQDFKSTFEQVPTKRRLLPLSLPALTELVEGIRPAKGKWSENNGISAPASYEIEEAGDELIEALASRLVAAAIYHMLCESKASEHSARMVAMKSASDKSKEVARDLTRVYNKIRQAAITREVSEIVGGREALSST
ncbi:MAG: F0F1 ATP synthase subunit gamma, partial [Minisyncoccia bacterium]